VDEISQAENRNSPGELLPRPYSTQWIGPVEFVASSPDRACELVVSLAKKQTRAHVHLSNAYTVALADKSLEYRRVLASPAINFPDGKPLSWVSSIKRQSPKLAQVRGPQLFLDVFDRGRAHSVSHFLLGATPEVLIALQSNLERLYPGVRIAGVESPPFRKLTSSELDAQDRRISESGAEIVWVGLGTPKQDVEAQRLVESLSVVAVAVGAAFDFTAGTLKQAPPWMTKLGLEWTYRFMKEPRRLWKRYVFGNARFLKTSLLWTSSKR
jgi:N-acetylglucosaminyldiphosphoundecaprenol N-acetyl-beta-D-mannosaminyltransferase